MLNSDRASPYVPPAPHRTPHHHPSTRCHPIQHLVQVPRKPPFAFDSPSLELTAQFMASSHHFHLGFNDTLLCTSHSRAASSSQSLPAEVGFQSYPPMGEKANRHQNSMNPWPLPTRPPSMITGRQWPGAVGLSPEVFLPGGDTQPYNSFLLESTDSSPSFSPDSDAFHSAAPPTVASTPIITADAPRLHDRPQDLVVYLSGSESDSGQEPDDERNMARDARQDQWTSISAASPRAKSPATASSRRSASFLATEVPSAPYSPIALSYCPSIGDETGFQSSSKRHRVFCSNDSPRPVVV